MQGDAYHTLRLCGHDRGLDTAAQVQQGGNDHAGGGSASAHLAVEDEGGTFWRLPQPPHQQGKVLLLGRLLICYWYTGVIHFVPVVCMSKGSDGLKQALALD